jgi:hypothetical protein
MLPRVALANRCLSRWLDHAQDRKAIELLPQVFEGHGRDGVARDDEQLDPPLDQMRDGLERVHPVRWDLETSTCRIR